MTKPTTKKKVRLTGAAAKARPTGRVLKCQAPGCGRAYYATPSRIRNGTMYCSIECKGAVRRVVRQCPQCLLDKVKGSDTFCGSDCYRKWKNSGQPIPRRENIPVAV